MKLDAIKTTNKTGKEPFIFNGEELKLNVETFWQWSSSELLENRLRGTLADFIVGSTIYGTLVSGTLMIPIYH